MDPKLESLPTTSFEYKKDKILKLSSVSSIPLLKFRRKIILIDIKNNDEKKNMLILLELFMSLLKKILMDK